VYYRDRNGVEPVNEFIDALAPERQEELDFKIGLLNRLTGTDPPLPFPHSSQVDGQLGVASLPGVEHLDAFRFSEQPGERGVLSQLASLR
jgi:hypothetical protein